MNSVSLIFSILGPVRGSVLPLAYAVDVTAERLFREHIAVDDLKLCEDVCRAVSKRLPHHPKPEAVGRNIARCANRCWDKLVADGLVCQYLGKPVLGIDSPRMLIIYLATYAYFDRPYFQMAAEHPELFTGQLPAVPSLP